MENLKLLISWLYETCDQLNSFPKFEDLYENHKKGNIWNHSYFLSKLNFLNEKPKIAYILDKWRDIAKIVEICDQSNVFLVKF